MDEALSLQVSKTLTNTKHTDSERETVKSMNALQGVTMIPFSEFI